MTSFALPNCQEIVAGKSRDELIAIIDDLDFETGNLTPVDSLDETTLEALAAKMLQQGEQGLHPSLATADA